MLGLHVREHDSHAARLRQDLLQAALRVLLVVFIGTTLSLTPPSVDIGLCFAILAAYVVILGVWGVWAVRRTDGASASNRESITLLAIGCDVAVISVLTVLTGWSSPESWTSNVLRIGLFLIPLIAAAQLDPFISAMVAIPTLGAYLAVALITQSENSEPWDSILLNAVVLAGLAGGAVALSVIQRAKEQVIGNLARQRTQLLEELVGLEKRERQALSERLHDGALQYVLVARGDLEEVETDSAVEVARVNSALTECSKLLRDVVRELHPEVLARSGLKAAVAALADSIAARGELTVGLDADTWPDDQRTDADYVLYGAAREISTNVIKHAKASTIAFDLERADGTALLRVADDGIGIPDDALERSVQNGHIGMASTRARILASGGRFDIRKKSPGTEIEISLPLH
jgi:two-component system, NarL family, sensor kinase